MPTPPAPAVTAGAASAPATGLALVSRRPGSTLGWKFVLPVGTQSSPPQHPPAVVPPPLPEVDPIAGPDFIRVDGTLKPARVSDAVWSEVFPGDYIAVRGLIGRHFARLASADAAVRAAVAEIEVNFWKSGSLSALVSALSPLLPRAAPGGAGAGIPARIAAMAVSRTSAVHWRAIFAAPFPARAAFALRSWHAAPGTCLACGGPSAAGDATFQGDSIHSACMPAIKAAGPVWGDMVVARVRELAAEDAARIPGTGFPEDDGSWEGG